jgi:murein peptide amidase A
MPMIKDKIDEKSRKTTSIRSVSDSLAAIDRLALNSVNLVRKPLPSFPLEGNEYYVPRYLFLGPKGGAEPIRVGLFSSVYGDEPEGSFALLDFVQHLERNPEIGRDYCLFLYPILNPSGFEGNTKLTSDGINIPNQIWKNSASPEVQALQSELWMHGFNGIVSFRTDPRAEDLRVAVGGSIFFRHLLGTTLPSAQDLLPQSIKSGHDALPRWRSILLDEPNDLIRAAPGLKPGPFEIVITLPRQVPLYVLKSAVSLLLQSVLAEYRKFISFGANI